MQSTKAYIAEITAANPRHGEGSGVLLKDGRILYIYSRFTGGKDHDFSELFGGILNPDTGELTDTKVYFPDPAALNQMSVSLERLQDSSIAALWLKKTAPDRDQILFARSLDEGVTWSEPEVIDSCIGAEYYVVNNDRLRQFSSGRIAVPVCVYRGPNIPGEDGLIMGQSDFQMLYSDDYGKSWQVSAIVPSCPDTPCPMPNLLNPGGWKWIQRYRHRECEPGVEEVSNGRIFLYGRTAYGTMHSTWSEDGGATFAPMHPNFDIVAPNGPESIRCIPGSKRLVCLYNDRSDVIFADDVRHFSWRTPLTLAVSDDDGATWHNLADVEDESHNYCYTSMLFTKEYLLLTYYESENLPDGTRRNLASLKMQKIALSELLK